jgi:hypothetical protein
MMELLIAILIALGSLTSPADFTEDFRRDNADAVKRATHIYETGSYTIERTETGGVVVVTGVGV